MTWHPCADPIGFEPDEWWPALVPTSEYADFSYDATDDLAPGDTIAGLSIANAPSGAGEVTLSRLNLGTSLSGAEALITVWITGGVPGRLYFYQIIITTTMIRQIPILIGQKCLPVLAQYPLPPPPAPGLGTPLTWAAS